MHNIYICMYTNEVPTTVIFVFQQQMMRGHYMICQL